MNPPPPPIPGIMSLYHIDPTIHRAMSTCGFSLFAAVGIKWATQPMPNAIPVEKSPFDSWITDLGPMVALTVSFLALLVLVWRYRLVQKILTQGIPLKGTVVEVDRYEREAPRSETSTAFNVPKTHSYYVTIRYDWQGADHQVRLKLPFSPSNYQISEAGDVDLILLDSAPKKPLIRKVYLGGVLPSKGWWRRF